MSDTKGFVGTVTFDLSQSPGDGRGCSLPKLKDFEVKVDGFFGKGPNWARLFEQHQGVDIYLKAMRLSSAEPFWVHPTQRAKHQVAMDILAGLDGPPSRKVVMRGAKMSPNADGSISFELGLR